MQVSSKLTAKAQTTIPREVRDKLALRPGDTIVYEIEGDTVRLRKLAPMDAAVPAGAAGHAVGVGDARGRGRL